MSQFVADLARQRDVDRSVVEAEFFQTARPSSLLKQFATVEEVANMIVYVGSPLAPAWASPLRTRRDFPGTRFIGGRGGFY